MSGNSSSGTPLLHQNTSWTSTDLPFSVCHLLRPSSFIYLGYFVTNTLLLHPLCILILYLGLVRWRKQSSTAVMMSHSDCFTYHMVVMEMVGILGYVICCWGNLTVHVDTYWVGYCLSSVPWYGELFFHILTCVERYLAVVHPVVYLTLRGKRGVKIRNVSIGCIWLLVLGEVGLLHFKNISAKVDILLLTFCLIAVSFCSLSVLCVLIRSQPGEQTADRERTDRIKNRAFFTLVAILAVLLLRCFWSLTWASLFVSSTSQCNIMASGVWFNLPSNMVLPLLFLQRAGLLVRRRGAR